MSNHPVYCTTKVSTSQLWILASNITHSQAYEQNLKYFTFYIITAKLKQHYLSILEKPCTVIVLHLMLHKSYLIKCWNLGL